MCIESNTPAAADTQADEAPASEATDESRLRGVMEAMLSAALSGATIVFTDDTLTLMAGADEQTGNRLTEEVLAAHGLTFETAPNPPDIGKRLSDGLIGVMVGGFLPVSVPPETIEEASGVPIVYYDAFPERSVDVAA